VGVFAIFMPAGNSHSHEDLVRMNLSHDALFRAPINAYTIADLQHFSVLPLLSSDTILTKVVAAKPDFLSG
jgi:hypothetical protein